MPRKKKKLVYKEMTLNELSNVDRPAQAPAKAVIIKRAKEEDVEKALFNEVLESMELEQKVYEAMDELWDFNNALRQSFHNILKDEEYPDKKQAMKASLSEYVAAVSTMVDTLPNGIQKKDFENIIITKESGKMSKEITKEDIDSAVKKALEEQNGKLEKAEKLSTMNDSQKVYYEKLDESKQDDFLKMSSGDMDKEIESFKKSDDTLEMNGTTITKSAIGDEAFKILKAQNEQIAKTNAENVEINKRLDKEKFEKSASELFTYLPGTVEEHGRVLKAIDGLDEDIQKSINTMLKSGEAAMGTAGLFSEQGNDGEITVTKKEDDETKGTMEILRKREEENKKK